MATDSGSTVASGNSPRHASFEKNNHQSRPPWTQIVRGGEPDMTVSTSAATVSASSSQSDEQATLLAATAEEERVDNGNARKPVWNKLSNGAAEIAHVMGAETWPALSESARVSTKLSSDSLKGLSDGLSSLSVSQGIGASSSSSQKQISNITIPNSSPDNAIPVRQRSMKRNTSNASANGGTPQSSGSQGQLGEAHANNPSPRDHSHRNFQSRAANDHQQQPRNSFRNRNGGSHNHRRDQERNNQDWNNHRNFTARDAHIQTQRGYPRFMRHPPPPPPPPPTSPPFIAPPSVRPYGAPMGFPAPVYYVAAPPESLGGLPFVAAPLPPHALFFPPPDFQLHSRILHQIDYYFSNENLIKDTYLRQNMDDQGWVSINLIASFNKVGQLTDSIPLILDVIRNSNVIEVQADKVRRRNDWMKWILPPFMRLPNVSNMQSSGNPSHEMLVSNVQHISLEENVSHDSVRNESDSNTEASFVVSSSSSFVNHSEPPKGEGTSQVHNQGDDYHAAINSSN